MTSAFNSFARILFTGLIFTTASGAENFECRWASSPPKIDGKLDDEAWKNAQVIESFQTAWLPEGHRTPPTKTKARLFNRGTAASSLAKRFRSGLSV